MAHLCEKVLETYSKRKLVIAHLGKRVYDESVHLADTYRNGFYDASYVISDNSLYESLEEISPLFNEEAARLMNTVDHQPS